MRTTNFKKSVSQETKNKISRALKGKKKGNRMGTAAKVGGAIGTLAATGLALRNRKAIGSTLSNVGMNVKGQMAKMASKGQTVAQNMQQQGTRGMQNAKDTFEAVQRKGKNWNTERKIKDLNNKIAKAEVREQRFKTKRNQVVADSTRKKNK